VPGVVISRSGLFRILHLQTEPDPLTIALTTARYCVQNQLLSVIHLLASHHQIMMLIESLISYAVSDLREGELKDAITYAQRAMRETLRECREPVVLTAVTHLQGARIKFTVLALDSRVEKEFIYNYKTRDLFAYRPTYTPDVFDELNMKKAS